jgi:hypothetical protein
MKTAKVQELDSLQQEFYGLEIDKAKPISRQEHRNPSNNLGNASKSPLMHSKQPIPQIKPHHNVNLKLPYNQTQSPRLKSDR